MPLSTPKVKAPMLSGGGGLNSTTEDYLRFAEMLRGKGTYRGVQILKPESLDTMLVDEIATGVDRKAWFYDALPGAGFGLGFERLIMYLTGMSNIRDVIPFPRTPRTAEF